MEQAEQVQKEASRLSREADNKKNSRRQIAQLGQREENLKKELAELQQGRADWRRPWTESVLNRYERLFKSKGENVVVGVQHGVCGRLPHEIARTNSRPLQAQKEIVACSNCGRILYYTRDMALAGRSDATRPIDSFAMRVQGRGSERFAISKVENIPAGHGTVKLWLFRPVTTFVSTNAPSTPEPGSS